MNIFQVKDMGNTMYDIVTNTSNEIVLDVPNNIIFEERQYSYDNFCCNEKFSNLGLYFYNYEKNTLIIHAVDDHSIHMINLDNYTM